jgi:hypothetical protein
MQLVIYGIKMFFGSGGNTHAMALAAKTTYDVGRTTLGHTELTLESVYPTIRTNHGLPRQLKAQFTRLAAIGAIPEIL